MELESGLKKDGQMKRARFTEEQIIAVLKEHAVRQDACRAEWASLHP